MPDNWRSIELKHLVALRSIAATGTFWAAAERLDTSQSTISDHVAALEALTGQRLIERSRGRRTVELTASGRLLLAHAIAVDDRLHAAEADFRAFLAGQAGTIRIGIYQSVAKKVLPVVMRQFRESWPNVEVELLEATQDDAMLRGIELGELDVAFAIQPVRLGPFETLDLMHDPYVLMVERGSDLAGRRPSVTELDGVAMVGYQPGQTASGAENFLLGHGIRPRMVFRTNDNGTVQAMVAAGVGVALAPLLAVDEWDPGSAIAALAEPIPPRVLTAVWHRDRYRTPAASAFVDIAKNVAGRIERAHDQFLAGRPG
jgi:DNA-binding transcriptional LysR family regulator